jgi:hypothetical protein
MGTQDKKVKTPPTDLSPVSNTIKLVGSSVPRPRKLPSANVIGFAGSECDSKPGSRGMDLPGSDCRHAESNPKETLPPLGGVPLISMVIS